MMRVAPLACAALLLAAALVVDGAQMVYVEVSGTDTAGCGGAPATPCATIGFALTQVQCSTLAADVDLEDQDDEESGRSTSASSLKNLPMIMVGGGTYVGAQVPVTWTARCSVQISAVVGAALTQQSVILSASTATVIVSELTFSNSFQAATVGCLFVNDMSKVSLVNVTVTGCTGTTGGVQVGNGAIVELEGCNFNNNKGTYGGGVFVTNGATFSDAYSSWTGNSANYGGAIFLQDALSYALTGSTFINNVAINFGGAVCAQSSSGNLEGVVVSNNEAGLGGGLSLSGSDTVLQQVSVLANLASQGGGFYVSGGVVTCSTCLINYNQANSMGGGVRMITATFNVLTSDIESNIAQSNGGGVSMSGGTLNVEVSNVMMNTAGDEGGAIACSNSGAVSADSQSVISNNLAGNYTTTELFCDSSSHEPCSLAQGSPLACEAGFTPPPNNNALKKHRRTVATVAVVCVLVTAALLGGIAYWAVMSTEVGRALASRSETTRLLFGQTASYSARKEEDNVL